MRIVVLYFGVLKEKFRVEGETLDIPEGSLVRDLLSLSRQRASNEMHSDVWGRLAVAVNREYSGSLTVLHEGDEVALLPPVSGGL